MQLTFPTPWVPVVYCDQYCALRYVENASEAWGGFVSGSSRPQVLFHTLEDCQKQCDRLNRVKQSRKAG